MFGQQHASARASGEQVGLRAAGRLPSGEQHCRCRCRHRRRCRCRHRRRCRLPLQPPSALPAGAAPTLTASAGPPAASLHCLLAPTALAQTHTCVGHTPGGGVFSVSTSTSTGSGGPQRHEAAELHRTTGGLRCIPEQSSRSVSRLGMRAAHLCCHRYDEKCTIALL